MAELHSADIQSKLKDIGYYISEEYLKEHPKKERDWRTYEQQYARRIKEAMRMLEPLIHEAVTTIWVYQEGETRGRPEMLTLEQKVKLLLIKQLVGESNRMFANMLDIFSMVSGMDVSYKTVERLYSDDMVMMALHNLLMLRRKGVTMSDATGDGTGYSLTIKRNYESYAQKLKDGAKEAEEDHRVRLFAFTIMDLKTRLYLACGSSLEKEAFEGAMAMLSRVDVSLSSMRLDRYYSYPTYVDAFGAGTKVYVIPKKNSTLNGSQKWKDTMKDFARDTVSYLEQYHKRSNSESGFSQDKKMLGWTVAQRREDRIGCALFSIGLWHNLFNLAP